MGAEQARDDHGRWTEGNGPAAVVAPHNHTRSVGTHPPTSNYQGMVKVGNGYQQTGPQPDRISARDAARAINPKAKSVSTGSGYNGSFDIRSHPSYEK